MRDEHRVESYISIMESGGNYKQCERGAKIKKRWRKNCDLAAKLIDSINVLLSNKERKLHFF